ncbi:MULTISPECIES: hypothetical protein [Francisella]|nr:MULTISPECIES: hypothetical protein [Francisella]
MKGIITFTLFIFFSFIFAYGDGTSIIIQEGPDYNNYNTHTNKDESFHDVLSCSLCESKTIDALDLNYSRIIFHEPFKSNNSEIMDLSGIYYTDDILCCSTDKNETDDIISLIDKFHLKAQQSGDYSQILDELSILSNENDQKELKIKLTINNPPVYIDSEIKTKIDNLKKMVEERDLLVEILKDSPEQLVKKNELDEQLIEIGSSLLKIFKRVSVFETVLDKYNSVEALEIRNKLETELMEILNSFKNKLEEKNVLEEKLVNEKESSEKILKERDIIEIKMMEILNNFERDLHEMMALQMVLDNERVQLMAIWINENNHLTQQLDDLKNKRESEIAQKIKNLLEIIKERKKLTKSAKIKNNSIEKNSSLGNTDSYEIILTGDNQ